MAGRRARATAFAAPVTSTHAPSPAWHSFSASFFILNASRDRLVYANTNLQFPSSPNICQAARPPATSCALLPHLPRPRLAGDCTPMFASPPPLAPANRHDPHFSPKSPSSIWPVFAMHLPSTRSKPLCIQQLVPFALPPSDGTCSATTCIR